MGRSGDCEVSQEAVERWDQGDASKIGVQTCSAQGPSETRGRGYLPWLCLEAARCCWTWTCVYLVLGMLGLNSLPHWPDRVPRHAGRLCDLCHVLLPGLYLRAELPRSVFTLGSGQVEAWCCLQDEGAEEARGSASLGHRDPPTPPLCQLPHFAPVLFTTPWEACLHLHVLLKPFRRVSSPSLGASIAPTLIWLSDFWGLSLTPAPWSPAVPACVYWRGWYRP